jgi:uncharacterized protein (DUF1697 family)
MTSFAALLRGINVGGNNQVSMRDLRDHFEKLGFIGVKTLLQSGNIVFKSRPIRAAALEQRLEKETGPLFGNAVDFMVRDAAEWKEIIKTNPFPRESLADPSHLLVLFLKTAPVDAAITNLKTAIRGREYFEARGRQLYIAYPDGIGRSKLTVALMEKKLGVRGTGRNWNTVLKLAALLEE